MNILCVMLLPESSLKLIALSSGKYQIFVQAHMRFGIEYKLASLNTENFYITNYLLKIFIA